jgi:Aspartyl protease
MLGAVCGLLLLCSCATPRPEPPPLPQEVSLAKGTGGSLPIIVTLRMEDGGELPCIVDTGSPITCLDLSLEPKLGRRLGKENLWSLDTGTNTVTGVYAAPKLFLGNTPLWKGGRVAIYDCKALSAHIGRPVMGILGMDVLQHYCIQLDFEAGKLRFLNTTQWDKGKPGKAFPLILSSSNQKYHETVCPFISQGGLIEASARRAEIDTGCNWDGFLNAEEFRRAVQGKQDILVPRWWHIGTRNGSHDNAWFASCVWNGGSYTNLLISQSAGRPGNIIGLRFLARHLVTLDFPGHTLYLQQTRVGPPAGDTMAKMMDETINPPAEFLEGLKQAGKLPGWLKNDPARMYCVYHSAGDANSITFVFRQTDDTSFNHYTVGRAVANAPWKLLKAWRSDPTWNVQEDYPAR